MSPLPYSIEQMIFVFGKFADDGLTAEQVNMLGEEGRSRLIKAWLEGQADAPKMKSVLHRLYEGEVISIRRLAGAGTIAHADRVFSGHIDSDFVAWGTDELDETTTPKQIVEIHEMVQNGNFQTIFESVGRPIAELVLTQKQVIAFCEDHRDKLRTEGFGTFFIFKVGPNVLPDLSNLFVARVIVVVRDLYVYVDRFSRSFVWLGRYRHRFVVPQQTA
ncbi:MAG: hypothetical protein WAW92_04235 [Minisyncoccia bacterium]